MSFVACTWWNFCSGTFCLKLMGSLRVQTLLVDLLVQQNIWEEPVVAFLPISGEVHELPDYVVKDLSRDQKLGYRYAHALQSGVMPDDLVGQAIGPMITSRWNTAAVRVMCKNQKTNQKAYQTYQGCLEAVLSWLV